MATTTKTRKRSTKKNGKTSQAIYQEVTDRIIAALDEGTVPWQRPWRSKAGVPHQNLSSKKNYRGVNPMLLDLVSLEHGYSLPYWLTFRQAKAMGGTVRRGEKATRVVFFKPLRIKDEEKSKEKGKDVYKKIPLLRDYHVFNVEQCDGLDGKIPPVPEEPEFDPIERAEQIGSKMKNAPALSYGGSRAFYNPFSHGVRLPARSQFKSATGYYSTKFHEFGHATGNEKCLGRVKDWSGFGTEPYAKEELVAEMCAAMLDSYAGLDVPVNNSADYIRGWLKKLKDDPKFVVSAASQAQRAADYILGEVVATDDD